MRIELLDTFPPELDAVADASPRSTFYHTGAWLHPLAQAYPRLSLRCLVAHDGGAPAGYLPFFESRRGPFRAAWSLPFGTYGGPVGGEEACRGLIEAFERRLSQTGMVEIGWVDFHDTARAAGWEVVECTTHILDLAGGFDVVWRERFDKARRRRVRRAEESGVTIRRGEGADDVARFVAVYRERLRGWDSGHGHPEQLFASLVERGGGRVRLYLAVHDGSVVGGHLNFYYKEAVTAWYGMTSPRAGDTQAGTLLYATCIREACEAGFATYNLGASLGRGSLVEYKESLGGAVYSYRMLRRRRLVARLAAWARRGAGGR
jgi:CelD/BcsL family acetyltransferase involved in cellulose biosynthesis